MISFLQIHALYLCVYKYTNIDLILFLTASAVIIQIGFAVIGAFCFTSLIVGTKKRNRWLLLPYIILSIIGLIANTVLVIRILASASDYKFQLVFGISYMLGKLNYNQIIAKTSLRFIFVQAFV